jgi:hypothetical protein
MAEISYGIEKILTPRSIASNLPSPKTTIAAGATTLGKANLPYLWAAKGRKRRRYWFYRRAGKLIPITSLEGRRLSPNEPGFGQVYDLIHEGFGAELQEHATGSLAHLIREYRASSEFKGLAPKSRTIYRRHLDLLEKHHGHRPISTLPREAVFKLRDEFQNTPSTANFVVTILRIILNYAEDRPKTFRLPPYWKNPAARPKRLKEGEGHRPWEEVEIAAFRKCWPRSARYSGRCLRRSSTPGSAAPILHR